MIADQLPSFMRLAFYIGLGSLALGVERVELLLEALVRGNAGVDCAALGFGVDGFMATPQPTKLDLA